MRKKILSFLVAISCLMAVGCTEKNTATQQKSSQPAVSTTTANTSQTEPTPEATESALPSLEAAPSTTEVTAAVEEESAASQQKSAVVNKGTAPEITLSGDPNDVFIAEENCYAVSENAVIYIERGATVRGHLIECAEAKMTDICKVTGLDFDLKTQPDTDIQSVFDVYYDSSSYVGMNEDNSRVNIMLVTLEGGEIEWAGRNMALLDDEDVYYDCEYFDVAHHELTHTILLNNGVNLGPTLEEGLATFYSEVALEEYSYNTWNWAQYYYPADFDDACILDGADGFDHAFHYAPDRSFHYIYGYIFCTFLEDVYGDDIFMDIRNAATKDGFDASFYPDNEEASLAEDTEQMKKIIISVTDNEVFDKFAAWYAEDWENEKTEWKAYMTSLGEDVSFM